MKYNKDNETLKSVLAMCTEYICDCPDPDEWHMYCKELIPVIHRHLIGEEVWDSLTGTGIFHDAIGEVISEDRSAVTVLVEYSEN